MALVLKSVSNIIDLLVFSIETKKRKLTITISATHYKLPPRMVACHVDIIVTTSVITRAGPDHSCLSSVTSVSAGWCPAGKHKQTEV